MLLFGVRGFRVRVSQYYRTPRSFGYGYGRGTKPTQVPGVVSRVYRTHTSSSSGYNKCGTPYPVYCGTGRPEFTEVPGTGMKALQTEDLSARKFGYCDTGVQNLQKFQVRV